ncbi:MAG: hypothetical protein PUP93_13050 [Rhizonema sp. NSF051]|nr:hypothetical protein [Rhizonema sp. NSF051]
MALILAGARVDERSLPCGINANDLSIFSYKRRIGEPKREVLGASATVPRASREVSL